MTNQKKVFIVLVVVVSVLLACFLFTGFFVIQPIGAIPEGKTIWFVRAGTTLPFISSADGLLLKKDAGVSLLGRAVVLSSVIDVIEDKIILKIPYVKALYLISTNGVEFE